MKRFNITVNGKAYDVVVDEVASGAAPAPVAAAPAPAAVPAPAAPAAAPVPAPAAAPAPAPTAGSTVINAPMPGTILDVKVKPGDTVKEGDVLVILEAMKMENEIMSPVSGTVASVAVTKGQSVNSNDLIATIA